MQMKFNASYINTRPDLLKYINGRNLEILDIGCATGENGRFLLEKGYARSVIGVELDFEMAQEAKNKIQEVFSESIENEKLLLELQKHQFDFILIGDVLEHLIDPWRVLRELSKALKQSGKIIISTPNVQHIDVFINVFINGTWPLNERGLFDKTHLRWFTKYDLKKLIEQATLKIEIIEHKFRFRDPIGSKFPFWSKPFKKLFPNLFTHQYIIVCTH